MRCKALPFCLLPLLCQCSQPAADSTLPPPAPAPVPEMRPSPPGRKDTIFKAQGGEGTLYMPASLCYLDEVVPGIRVDLKYCGSDNFVGRPVAGYTTGTRAILRRDAADCLRKAQEILAPKGYGLLVWDAYRPHQAMEDFYTWSRTPDESMKREFYPNITKQGIYENQYIRRASEHSWGIAVDVTLVDLNTGKELDMGGRHDLLDASSATRYPGLTPEQRANRLLLRDSMDKAGMRNYSKEWWHYFLKEKTHLIRYDFPLCDTLLPHPDTSAVSQP